VLLHGLPTIGDVGVVLVDQQGPTTPARTASSCAETANPASSATPVTKALVHRREGGDEPEHGGELPHGAIVARPDSRRQDRHGRLVR
jgi:hypothetical protein